MDKCKISIALLFMLLGSIQAQEADEIPGITFTVTAEQEVEADILIVSIGIEKKDKNFKNGSVELSKVVDRLTVAVKKVGIPVEDIITDKLSSIPDTNWWNGKEYLIRMNMNVKIHNKELIPDLFSVVGSIDPSVTVEGFDYEYSTMDQVKLDLIKLASTKAEAYKIAYEKNFGVKLSLYTINANDDINEIGRKYRNAMGVMKESSASYDDQQFTKLPVKKVRMTFFCKYMLK